MKLIQNNKYKIGVIGYGFVGRATAQFACEDIEVLIYDIDPKKSTVNSISDLAHCNVIFVCLPTPMKKNGSADISIVKKAVLAVKQFCPKAECVIRSTVPVGLSKSLDCCFMPEFLTEKNWESDFFNCENWIFGKDRESSFDFEDFILVAWKNKRIYSCSNKIINSNEAEMIKYIRNTFLTVKVSYLNEIYRFCEKSGLDYSKISKIACSDPRIGLSHINVPGLDGKFGFGGTCFPKDLNSLIFQMEDLELEPYILKAANDRNLKVDRKEKDWENLKGRAVV